VIVVRSVTPSILTQHLPVLLHSKKVPCIPLHCDCKQLGEIFGLRSAAALGLKVRISLVDLRCSFPCKKIPEVAEIKKDLMEFAKIPEMPWMDDEGKVKYIPISQS
jgi:ribosomal protein L7Ae-like RNA K-turn-binding protein